MKALTNQGIVWPQPRLVQKEIIYPESDGQPMADNTKQFRAITTIQGNLDRLYKDPWSWWSGICSGIRSRAVIRLSMPQM